ncbi:hypothetical protein F53441_13419 [Fusarium austroafricanum]|uniref:Uncharacterized protein n=1 Tax=Fusarium austroafricanum TaxID=2364996 RepID=A0A8H4NRC6_9HYPO|nr:hypothetical protein F53441_13419 [Fusarium austroafricanum]
MVVKEESSSRDTSSEKPEFEGIRAKIEEYRNSMRARFNSYSVHPWDEHDHGWTPRLRIFHFDEGNTEAHSPRLDRRDNPQHLWQNLEEALERQPSGNPQRTLILLEGLDARIAEALSVKYDIPHDVWVVHYDSESQLRLLDPDGFDSTSSTYWKIIAPMRVAIIWNEPPGDKMTFERYSGSCSRSEGLDLDLGDNFFNSNSELSFWGKHTANGWIALVVMDTPHGFLLPETEDEPRVPGPYLTKPVDESSISPSENATYVLSGSDYTTNHRIHPKELSLWDTAAKAYESQSITTTDDPFSATIILRNFVFCKWEDRIKRDWNLHETIWRSDIEEIGKQDIRNHNLLLERSRKIGADFQEIRSSRQFLQQAAVYVRRCYQTFRCDDMDYLSSPESPKLRAQLSQESKRWTYLQEHIKVLDELISGQMIMYAQRAAMDEAFATRSQAYDSYMQTRAANEQAAAANRTARSSGQLAKIATVAVPCTIAASILSMNGDFAAGERYFFVYWCVALPLTFAMLAWVLYKDFREWRENSGKDSKESDNEKGLGDDRSSGYYSGSMDTDSSL